MLMKLKKLIHESRHGLLLVTYAILGLFLMSHFNGFFNNVQKILALFRPLLYGFCIAYVLNIPMAKIEAFLMKKKNNMQWIQNKVRTISIALTVVLACVLLTVLFFIIVPQLIDSLLVLLSNLGMYIENILDYIVILLDNLHIQNDYITEFVNDLQNLPWNEIFGNVVKLIGETSEAFTNIASNLMNSTVNFAGKLGMFITAFMISLYLLASKEDYIRQTKRVSLAFFGREFTEIICDWGRKINEIFKNFIGGQLLEAFILFSMYCISMTILQMPYALLISALIAITSIIPYFGAMLGSAVGFILIFAINPIQAVGFYIFFQVLQQIENNFIYPKVVGKSVGLPAIWVVIGILAFGSMFGMLGMIIAVPTCAVLYQISKNVVHVLLQMREIDPNEESEI